MTCFKTAASDSLGARKRLLFGLSAVDARNADIAVGDANREQRGADDDEQLSAARERCEDGGEYDDAV